MSAMCAVFMTRTINRVGKGLFGWTIDEHFAFPKENGKMMDIFGNDTHNKYS